MRSLLVPLLVYAGGTFAQTPVCDGTQSALTNPPGLVEGPVIAAPTMKDGARSEIAPPWVGFYPESDGQGSAYKVEFYLPNPLIPYGPALNIASALWSESAPSQLFLDTNGQLTTSELWGGPHNVLTTLLSKWELAGDFEGRGRYARHTGNSLMVCEQDCLTKPQEVGFVFSERIHWVRFRWPEILVVTVSSGGEYSAHLVDVPSRTKTALISHCDRPMSGDFDARAVFLGCSGVLVRVERQTLVVTDLFDNPCAYMEFGFPQLTNNYLVFQEYFPGATPEKVEVVAINLDDIGQSPLGDRPFRVGKSDLALRSVKRPSFTAQYFGADYGSKSVVTWWVHQDTSYPQGLGVTYW